MVCYPRAGEGLSFETAKELAVQLRRAGHQAYFVGGCVRDLLRGVLPEDYDIVTSALPWEVQTLFPRAITVGISFGVLRVPLRGHFIDVATFRHDDGYVDGRHPASLRFASVHEDIRRRDFTINGLLMDPETGQVFDEVGGQADLRGGVVRTIGDPRERFAEDHLRMLRAVRFAATMGFTLAEQTLRAIQSGGKNLLRISGERIRHELDRILSGTRQRSGLELLATSGLLSVILPEVATLCMVDQPGRFHPEGNVFNHIVKMLDVLDQGGAFCHDPLLSWGVLLHDVGKALTRTEDTEGVHFYGHVRRGEEVTRMILGRLAFSRADGDAVIRLVRYHMHFMTVAQMRPSRLKRFLRMPDFPRLLELHRLDCLGSHGRLDHYRFYLSKSEEYSMDALRPPRLITGDDLKALGFAEGPVLGKILHQVEDAQLNGEVKTAAEAKAWIMRQWGGSRAGVSR